MKAEFTYDAEDIEQAMISHHIHTFSGNIPSSKRWVCRLDTLYHVVKVTLEPVEPEPKGAESA